MSKISRLTSVGSRRVRLRVMVVKSANRTLIVTVRPIIRGRADPGRGAVAELEQLAVDVGRVVDVELEGLVRADAALATLRPRRGAGRGPRTGRAGAGPALSPSARRSVSTGVCAMSATVCRPSRSERLLGLVPHPPQRPDGQLLDEGHHLVAGHDDHAVGLGQSGRELGDELRRRDPDRAGDALLVVDGVADQLADPRRVAEPADRARHVEEGLVEGERLDDRGDRLEGRHHRVPRWRL